VTGCCASTRAKAAFQAHYQQSAAQVQNRQARLGRKCSVGRRAEKLPMTKYASGYFSFVNNKNTRVNKKGGSRRLL
jgi:hypothetical protein